MRFSYADSIHEDFPELVTGVLFLEGITASGNVGESTAKFYELARDRLRSGTEGTLPEVQAWRRVFTRMDLKPTQYRCASEALLRRFRKDDALTSIHPLVDVCNAISIAFAIPIAVFDLKQVSGDLEVRRANGDEIFATFGGEVEHPEAGEVIFADSSERAHARRWTNRQSGYSAVRNETASVLIVSEAMHDTGVEDIARLTAAIRAAVMQTWPSATTVEWSSR